MQQLNTLSNDADQLVTFQIADGSDVQLEFIYRAGIQRWTLTLTHTLLTLSNLNLCQGPNLLRQWRNLISFGLAVIATDGLDPVDISDFVTGRVAVYMLTADEVAQVESTILAPVPLVNA